MLANLNRFLMMQEEVASGKAFSPAQSIAETYGYGGKQNRKKRLLSPGGAYTNTQKQRTVFSASG